MLHISGLNKSYGTRAVFEDTGFSMSMGERLGLVGRNGSGKTTLMRLILGRERPESGSIALPSGTKVGHLEQHISLSAPSALAEACLALPPTEDHRDESYRAQRVLAGLGFTEQMLDSAPEELSGGYQVRLSLAKALLSEPEMLLLDEPTNYLDIVSIRWLAGFLRSWRGGLLLITHDRTFMDSVCQATVLIHRKKLIKVAGSTAAAYAHILREEEHYEKARINDDKKRREIEVFVSRFRSQARRANMVQSRIKAMSKNMPQEKLVKERELEFRFTEAPFIGKWMLEADALGFGYASGDRLIDSLSFIAGPRERIAVIGRNGAGKTTLLKLLAGELTPSQGDIRINTKAQMAYFGQTNVDRLSAENTIEEELMSVSAGIGQNAARNIAGAMMFTGDEALKKIRVLSGGERSRVLLGKILASPANLLLLDEPTNHLDMQSVDSLIEAVEDFSGSVIIVTHSETILRSFARKLVVFDNGQANVFDGTYDEFLERQGWSADKKDQKDQKGQTGNQKAQAEESPASRKALRQQRAAIVQARSETLGPLKARLERLEQEIMSLEERTEEINHELVEASQTGEAKAIARLSKELHEAQAATEKHYMELAETSDEHDRLEKEYAQQLGKD